MEKNVHYFSFYLNGKMEEQRQAFPASFAKVEYVKNAIKKTGSKLFLVSTAIAKVGEGYLKGEKFEVDDNEIQIYLPTFKYKNALINKFSVLFMRIQIILYVLFKVKKDDDVLIYHSLAYIQPFSFLRKIKNFNLILEFNDLYHVADDSLSQYRVKENEFIKDADKYLFMNSLAAEKYNDDKPYVLSYGNYDQVMGNSENFSDGKTHVVYAGIIENGRKAAVLATKSALYLNSSHKIHILGFGEDEEVASLKNIIKEINVEKGYEAVVFHGKLRGQEFSDFLRSCHIGISSHAYKETEMDSANYTFPSKIPTYISHDLYVVSPNIPCVVRSAFSEFTTFYEKHTPEEIADAIKRTTRKDCERKPSDLIREMDDSFCKDVGKLLNV